jgi:hypothetical protein
MKMICAHPHAVHPEGELLDVSPKMRWLKQSLEKIRDRGEKVIVFTELRDIQRALQLMILDCFGLHVTVVNGDTNPSGSKGPSRQTLIDDFQRKQGFNVIILSTTAVGFGVNVQAANHVFISLGAGILQKKTRRLTALIGLARRKTFMCTTLRLLHKSSRASNRSWINSLPGNGLLRAICLMAQGYQRT